MSTLMNYTFQSFNFRGRDRLRPFYSLTAAIAAEEYSHIEAVSYAINLLLTGTTKRGHDPVPGPLAGAADARNTHHFIASGQAALPQDPWARPGRATTCSVPATCGSTCSITSSWNAAPAPIKCGCTKW